MMASGQRSTDPSSAGGAEAPGLRSPRTRSHGGEHRWLLPTGTQSANGAFTGAPIGLGGHSVGAPNASTTPNTVGHDGRHLDQAQAGAPADRPPGPRRSAAGLGDSPRPGQEGHALGPYQPPRTGREPARHGRDELLSSRNSGDGGIQPTEARVFHRARRVQDAKLLPYEPGLHRRRPSEGPQ